MSRPKTKNGPKVNDVNLSFNTTVVFERKLWTWAGSNLGNVIFGKFDSTQASLIFEKLPEPEKKQDPLFTSAEDVAKMQAEDRAKPDFAPPVQTDERRRAVEGTTADEATKLSKQWGADKKGGHDHQSKAAKRKR